MHLTAAIIAFTVLVGCQKYSTGPCTADSQSDSSDTTEVQDLVGPEKWIVLTSSRILLAPYL
jgi:hypothetical protein